MKGTDDEWINEIIMIVKNRNLLLIENWENEFIVLRIIFFTREKWQVINRVEIVKFIKKK